MIIYSMTADGFNAAPLEYYFGASSLRVTCEEDAQDILLDAQTDAVHGSDGDQTAEEIGVELGYDKVNVATAPCPDDSYSAMISRSDDGLPSDPKEGGLAIRRPIQGRSFVEIYNVSVWDEESEMFLAAQRVDNDDW